MSAVVEGIAIENLIKAQAYGLGFDLVGITSLGAVETAAEFDAWISRGHAGQMTYLERGAEKRRNTRLPYPAATFAIVVGLDYGGREPAGPIARYARGDDYHEVMVARLDQLHVWLESQMGRRIDGKSYCDTGPILERDLARRAGLGWFGKNTSLINPGIGSFFFIGALLVDLELKIDAPFQSDRCGTCSRCLDACPTDAFVGPRQMDATRCISYLTIENRGGIAEDLREPVGGMVYGCDICQDVCPWNVRFARELEEDAFRPRPQFDGRNARELAIELLTLNDDSYAEGLRGSPMKRAKLRGLARNAAVVLGNVGDHRDVALLDARATDADPMLKEHFDWARHRIAMRGAEHAPRDEGPAPKNSAGP